MNHARFSAMIALLLLVAAVANFVFSRPGSEEFGPPAYSGGKVQLMLAELPRIGDFYREFEVNQENPFVPLSERKRPGQHVPATPGKEAPSGKKDPGPLPPPPSDGRSQQGGGTVLVPIRPVRRPDCLGLVASVDRQLLAVRMGEDASVIRLLVGEVIEGWRLIELCHGTARFRDPDGKEQVIVIGLGAPAIIQQPAGAASAPFPDPTPARVIFDR